MIKVQKHGTRRRIINPANGAVTEEIPVTFIEEGRGGLNNELAQTSALLSEHVGANVGLNQFRTHTFAVKVDEIGRFPLNAELPFFINRKLTSTPQMRQQENVFARMVDGKLTYVSTFLSRAAEEDKDYRTSLEVMVQVNPGAVLNAQTGTARVELVQAAPVAQEPAPVVHEPLTQ